MNPVDQAQKGLITVRGIMVNNKGLKLEAAWVPCNETEVEIKGGGSGAFGGFESVV